MKPEWPGRKSKTERPTDRPTKPFVGQPPGSGKKQNMILSQRFGGPLIVTLRTPGVFNRGAVTPRIKNPFDVTVASARVT